MAQKKTNICSCCSRQRCPIYDRQRAQTRDLGAGGFRVMLEFERVRVSCPDYGTHMEYLDWLARHPRYTACYALHVGVLCRKMTVKDVACSERLHHSTVKDSVIGVDEIAIRKGQDYREVVSDLEQQRPIWFGGTGRKQRTWRSS